MARVFAITTTATSLRLDAQGQADTSFTVSNASGRALRGRAEVRATNAAQQAWLSVVGETERSFPSNGTHQIVVRVAAPPGTPAGRGSFRLDMVSAQNPDDDFAEGPAVTFEVPAPAAAKAPFPWWIVIVAATVVVIVGGLGTYLMMRERPPQQTETTLPCSQEKSLPSFVGAPTSIEFVNNRSEAVKIYFLDDYTRGRLLTYTIEPGQTHFQNAYVASVWVVADSNDTCLTIYRPVQSTSNRVIVK